jgi:hypothetical protein
MFLGTKVRPMRMVDNLTAILPPNQSPPCSFQSHWKTTLTPYPPNSGLKQSHPRSSFGYRKRHSTVDQTHRLVQRIHTALDSKQYSYSNPSGPMVYNSGALLPPPTLKFWNDYNLRSCAWLWTPHDTSLIHSSEGTSATLQSKKKSAVTALAMVIDFAPIQIISQ